MNLTTDHTKYVQELSTVQVLTPQMVELDQQDVSGGKLRINIQPCVIWVCVGHLGRTLQLRFVLSYRVSSKRRFKVQ